MPPRIAVFTKNRTNPAYDAARLGADRVAARLGAATLHYVPEKPDDVVALGVLKSQPGPRPKPLVVGVNAIPESVAAIASGRMLATADSAGRELAPNHALQAASLKSPSCASRARLKAGLAVQRSM